MMNAAITSNESDVDSVRIRGLDRSHHVSAFYRRVDVDPERRRLKEVARLAFVAHAAAVRDGDDELAAATLARLQAATEKLAPGVARMRCRMEVAA